MLRSNSQSAQLLQINCVHFTFSNQKTSADFVIFLAGNKADCAEHRAVPYRDAEKYAKENGLLFAETSAKLGMNVTEMFLSVGKLI